MQRWKEELTLFEFRLWNDWTLRPLRALRWKIKAFLWFLINKNKKSLTSSSKWSKKYYKGTNGMKQVLSGNLLITLVILLGLRGLLILPLQPVAWEVSKITGIELKGHGRVKPMAFFIWCRILNLPTTPGRSNRPSNMRKPRGLPGRFGRWRWGGKL